MSQHLPAFQPSATAAPGFPPREVFESPYAPPPQGFLPPPPQPRSASANLGVVALIVSVIATVGASLVGAMAAIQIGPVIGTGLSGMSTLESGSAPDLGFLSPVRSWVLLAEISFWVGTALGIWALAQGIVAIVRRSGSGFGIGAVIVAVLGPVVFTKLVGLALMMSTMTGSAG